MAAGPGHHPRRIVGLLLEHTFRTVLSRPVPDRRVPDDQRTDPARRRGAAPPRDVPGPGAAPCRPRAAGREDARPPPPATVALRTGAPPATTAEASDERLGRMPFLRAVGIGAAQIAALCPGISRSGVTMATGLLRGLSHEDAARFSFLLSTPVILAAGVLKLGDLAGPLGDGVRPQILVGSLLSFIGAYLSVRFLTATSRTVLCARSASTALWSVRPA